MGARIARNPARKRQVRLPQEGRHLVQRAVEDRRKPVTDAGVGAQRGVRQPVHRAAQQGHVGEGVRLARQQQHGARDARPMRGPLVPARDVRERGAGTTAGQALPRAARRPGATRPVRRTIGRRSPSPSRPPRRARPRRRAGSFRRSPGSSTSLYVQAARGQAALVVAQPLDGARSAGCEEDPSDRHAAIGYRRYWSSQRTCRGTRPLPAICAARPRPT